VKQQQEGVSSNESNGTGSTIVLSVYVCVRMVYYIFPSLIDCCIIGGHRNICKIYGYTRVYMDIYSVRIL